MERRPTRLLKANKKYFFSAPDSGAEFLLLAICRKLCYTKVTEHIGNSFVIFGYNGRDGVVTDKNGLIYMRARYYSPVMKRFVNADILHGTISDSTSLNRYSYVNGNPVSFVDPFGLASDYKGPTSLEAAYMAQHIYNATEEHINVNLGEKFGGWILVGIYDPGFTDIGLKVGVYAKTVNNKTIYSLVYAGTNMDWVNPDSLGEFLLDAADSYMDWVNNIYQPFGLSADQRLGIIFAKKFVEQNDNSNITFIGHSKGGSEAAAAAVATNQNAILFNPATVSLGMYGLSSNDYTSDMTAYIVKGEILNSIFGPFSTPIDEAEFINLDEGGLFKNHSIGTIIDYYEDKGIN